MNREIDALLAEHVMGWRRQYEGGHLFPAPDDPERKKFQRWNGEAMITEIPRYTASIEAAWNVVERLNQTMPETWTFSLFGAGDDWHVEIDSNDGSFLQAGPSVHVFERAGNAPMAICKAALKTRGIEVGDL